MALYAFDGTWNEPAAKKPEKFDTNVVRFIACLTSPEQLGLVGMLSEDAEYVTGVGTRFDLPGNWFELVACVNYDLDTAVAVGQGQHATTAAPWIPTQFGRLSLFANDAESKYDNNEGSLTVTIKRVS